MDERDLTTKSAAWDAGVRSNKRGFQRGWRAACEALAEWHEEEARRFFDRRDLTGDRIDGEAYHAKGQAHESSAVECRRRAGE